MSSVFAIEDEVRCAGFFSELHPDHALLLKESCIKENVAAARQYESVATKARLKGIGFVNSQLNVVPLGAPALLIPIWGMDGQIKNYELRPNKPRIRDGKPIKYERPKGSSAFYQSENDVVGQFIEEKLIVNESAFMRSGRLYDVFKEWCAVNGEQDHSNKWLTQRLTEKGFQKKARNDGAWWLGLGLLTDEDERTNADDGQV